jgi:succinate dehydrogenase / fumarate reductase, membrane anchor subunit
MGNGTSIGRVRGLGSAHSGVHHWLVIRTTALGSLLLTVWLAVSLLTLPSLQYPAMREWLSGPLPATALALFVVVNIWHARLGLQVVVEDYVNEPANKLAALTAFNLAAFAGAAFGLFCILRLALGAA